MIVQMYGVVNEIIYNTEAFFAQPVKNKQEAQGKIIEMSRNNDYITVDLLLLVSSKVIINSLIQIYQDNQIQVFLSKLILQEIRRR